MGGNAIKAVVENPSRLSKEEYLSVQKQITDILDLNNNTLHYHAVQSFADKQDFGDLDVIVVSKKRNDEELNNLINNNKYKFVKNGDVTSFVFEAKQGKLFQVDIIYSSVLNFDIACAYHGKGDVGNLIGRIAKQMGLKFGHDGLWYIHKKDTYVVGEILLSKEMDQILLFLGFDSNTFNKGFETKEDVYRFVTSSPYFHPSFYLWENRDHASRVRDMKRPLYHGFLEFIKTQEYPEESIVGKDFYLVALHHFDAWNALNFLLKKESQRMLAKMATNVDWVLSVSGLDRKKDAKLLGELMKQMKEAYPADFFEFKSINESRNKYLAPFINWFMKQVNSN
jgi:hypothetical protein